MGDMTQGDVPNDKTQRDVTNDGDVACDAANGCRVMPRHSDVINEDGKSPVEGGSVLQ